MQTLTSERRPAAGETIEADVCVIGAGPAGLAIAAALAGGSRDVLLIESGDTSSDPETAALNEGDCEGDPYAGLQATRHRQIGGSAALWNTRTPRGNGAKLTPLAAIDLECRQAVAHSGWPLSFDDLVAWYERAHEMCELGAFAYDADRWKLPDRQPLDGTGDDVGAGIYRFVARDDLLGPMLRRVRSSGNVRLVTRATACELSLGGARRVRYARVVSPEGRWTVAARAFVLAGGAVENARMLLTFEEKNAGMVNRHGWVGRCFMEHPRDACLTVRPSSRVAYRRLRFCDQFEGNGGAIVGGRLALREESVRSAGLLNASATLLPALRPWVAPARRVLGPVARHGAVDQWMPRGGHGWSRHRRPAVVFEGLRVLINLEQAPDPENRIVLSRRHDAHGVPLPSLRWRWGTRDEASRQRVRDMFSDALGRAGIGRVELRARPVDPNAHHHAGTTRMHDDPRHGVVDAQCRVHGLENVFVAGASVFPTAGFANPVLTILALSLRLGHHLREDRQP